MSKAKKSAPKEKRASVLINVILDRSGSMGSRVNDTIGGFNSYINELKKDKDTDYTLSLMQFDHEFLKTYVAVPLSTVPELTPETYQPRGSTALFDAIGYAVTAVDGAKVDKVLTVILTDGEENASREYNKTSVKILITSKEGLGNWTFVFLGADLSAFSVGDSIGVRTANSVAYNTGNVQAVYTNTAAATMNFAKSSLRSADDLYATVDQKSFSVGGMSRRSSTGKI